MILKRLSLCAIQILAILSFSYCAPTSGSYSMCSRCGRKKIDVFIHGPEIVQFLIEKCSPTFPSSWDPNRPDVPSPAWRASYSIQITRTSMVEVEDLYHLQHNDPCLQITEGSARDQKKIANNLCKKLVETYLASRMYKKDQSSCKDAEFFGCERDDAEIYGAHRCTVQFKTTGMWPLSSIGSHKKLLLCVEKDAEWYAKTQQEYGASHGLTEVPRLEPSFSRKKSRPKSSSEDFPRLWCQPLPARSTSINAFNEIFYSGGASFELRGRPTD